MTRIVSCDIVNTSRNDTFTNRKGTAMRTQLIKARRAKGLTQADIAKKINVTRACYSNYETGSRNPSLEVVVKLKQILDVTDDQIFLPNM